MRELRITQRESLDRTGLSWDEAKLSKTLSSPNPSIRAEERERLIDFLADHSFTTQTDWAVKRLEKFPDYFYFLFLRYLGHTLATEQQTKKLATGTYRLFRPSLKLPDMFTMGLFDITHDPDTDALCVREVRKFTPVKVTAEDRENAKSDPDVRQKIKLEYERPISETFVGYMIRKRRRYICFQRAEAIENPIFVFTVFNDEFIEGDKNAQIQSLGGVSYGTRGSRLYVSRVFIERVEDELKVTDIEKTINYIPGGQIKPSVLAYLAMPVPSPYYQVF